MTIVSLGGLAYSVETPPATPGTVVTVATPARRPGPLVVVGDSYTSPRSDGLPMWPDLLADRLGLELVNLAAGGAGYVRGFYGETFPAEVAVGLPADASVVIVFGGLNDRWEEEPATNVRLAARATFAAVRRLAPAAKLIVVGPQSEVADPAAITLEHRDVVRAEALAVSATWIDPLEPAWFADPALIGPDRLHPAIPAGQAAIADHLESVVADALAQ